MNQLKKLEKAMISYQQLTKINSLDEKEVFVTLEPRQGALEARYFKLKDMEALTGKKILVRKPVKNKLISASKEITKLNKNWRLFVTYGYRAPTIQTKYFLKNLIDISNKLTKVPSPLDLYEAVHRQVAIPEVAGHPTGGAVDVCLINTKNKLINCGSKIYDLQDISRYTFINLKNKNTKKARFTLRKAMLNQGFAPFDGEWWHFSYGDKEWATYYKKPTALYSQVSLNNDIIKNICLK